jgi:ligand-binding sensor domain-containing protein/signal transduction histidine kinase/CheY-like chemotaxis protein
MKKITFFFFFLISCMGIRSQTSKFYALEDGLSSSLINQIYQDRKGFIWIATESGLNKFDGNKFVVYRKIAGDSTSLLNDYVQTLFEDSSGNFWIRCFGGLMKYDRDTDSFCEVEINDANGEKVNPSMGITSIIERRNGDVWFASTGLGLFSLKKGDTRCRPETQLNLRLCSQNLTVICEDSSDRLWIGSENSGLNVYSFDTDEMLVCTSSSSVETRITSNAVSAICEGENGDIFVGTLNGGLNRFEAKSMKINHIHGKDGNRHIPVKVLVLNKAKQLFVGTDGFGMKLYNPETQALESYEPFSVPFDFLKAKIHCILEDREGNTWIGIFQKGIFFIPANPNGFRYYGYKSFQKSGIGSNCVMAIHKDRKGTLWVGTDSDGLYAIDEQAQEVRHYENTNRLTSVPNTIICIHETDDGYLWLGSYLDGFALFDKTTGRCRYIKSRINSASSNNKIYCMADDRKGGLWIGTYNGGLYKYDIASQSIAAHYLQSDDDTGLVNNWINSLLYDEEGLLWIGTFNGLSCLNTFTNRFLSYRKENSNLPSNIVYSLKKDRLNNIWIGTVEGLACLNKTTQEMQTFTIQDGLPSNEVCSIEDDGEGNIWLSTLSGISRYSPQDGDFTNYYSSDGLQGNEFTRSAHFKAADGELFFGGINGITHFLPGDIRSKKGALNVYITEFSLFGKSVHKGQKSGTKEILDGPIMDVSQIKLASRDDVLGFEFSIMEYGNLESIYYHYILENFDTEWKNTPHGINRITYTNLNPGSYRLLFQASDREIKSPIRSIEIIIRSPWFMSLPARISYVFLILLLLYGIYWFITFRIRQRNAMLRLEHADQIKEAKLQFFINISHEIRTPMTLIIGPMEKLLEEICSAELQNTYLLIYRNAQRIMRLINQLMDVRKIDRGEMRMKLRETDMDGFVRDIMQAFEYTAKKRNITFNFSHDRPELKVWIDMNNFDKVLFNIFANAFKYTTGDGEIAVYMTSGTDPATNGVLRNYCEIKIMDTGVGIDKEEINRIFERFYQIDNEMADSNIGAGVGLHIARSIVELHHGVLFAENRTDRSGSCFIIRLPLGSAHLKKEEIKILPHDAAPVHVHLYKDELMELENHPEDLKVVRAKTKYRILIVEDDQEISNYLKTELSSIYKIHQLTNGKDALAFILLEKPDLVISDIMMPEMDGSALCRKIKSNVNVHHIPIILLTAKVEEKDMAEGLKIGADAYVMKPFNSEMLKIRIANILGNRERLKGKSQAQSEGQIEGQIEIKSYDEILMEKVRRVINEHLANPGLNGEMLSKCIGMSRAHLHRKMKELTNQSARDFIRTIRLQEAGTLLKNKKLTISQVYDAVGFTGISHFSSSFKDFYGVSPREYMEGYYAKSAPRMKKEKNSENSENKDS